MNFGIEKVLTPKQSLKISWDWFPQAFVCNCCGKYFKIPDTLLKNPLKNFTKTIPKKCVFPIFLKPSPSVPPYFCQRILQGHSICRGYNSSYPFIGLISPFITSSKGSVVFQKFSLKIQVWKTPKCFARNSHPQRNTKNLPRKN